MSIKIGLKIKKALLVLLIFSLPYEYWDPFDMREVLTIPKIIGYLYGFLALVYLKESFNLNAVWPKVKMLLIIWIWMLLMSLFNYADTNKINPYNLSFLQVIIFYWLISSDLYN